VAADRVLIAVVCIDDHVSDTGTYSGTTIGGVAASTDLAVFGSGSRSVIICHAAVPTGTSGNVVVTNSKETNRNSVHLFRATGLLSLSSRDTANAASSAGPVNIDVLAGGFIIAGVAEPAIGNVSWTGLTAAFTASSSFNRLAAVSWR
jgi:hypothetical protein